MVAAADVALFDEVADCTVVAPADGVLATFWVPDVVDDVDDAVVRSGEVLAVDAAGELVDVTTVVSCCDTPAVVAPGVVAGAVDIPGVDGTVVSLKVVVCCGTATVDEAPTVVPPVMLVEPVVEFEEQFVTPEIYKLTQVMSINVPCSMAHGQFSLS